MTELAPFVGPAHVTDLDDLGGSNVWGDGRIRVLRVIARLNVGGPALQTSVLSDMLDPGRFDQRIVAGSVGEAEGDYVSLPRLTCQCSPSAVWDVRLDRSMT